MLDLPIKDIVEAVIADEPELSNQSEKLTKALLELQAIVGSLSSQTVNQA